MKVPAKRVIIVYNEYQNNQFCMLAISITFTALELKHGQR